MNKTVICPGSFDPVTLGHLDIITRAAKMFDRVIVAVLVNSAKTPTFSTEERIELLREEYCKKCGVGTIVKGLRAVSDFEYEFQMALANKKLNPELETVFLAADADSTFLSSSMVREIASMGGDISNFVPACVHDRIVERLRK